MNVALINGSPKIGQESNSGILLNFLKQKIAPHNIIFNHSINRNSLKEEQIREFHIMDVIVIAFPLYCDAPPSHLVQMMVQIENYSKNNTIQKRPYVYVIVNNGFYEGKQNEIALEIMKNWCDRVGFIYGQGIGHGAGEMLPYIKNVPLGHGPLKNLGRALDEIAKNITNKQEGENIFLSPNFPYIGWKFMATNVFWNGQAKKNGINKKDIIKKL
jgi:multimeric flavodoxin WrbA